MYYVACYYKYIDFTNNTIEVYNTIQRTFVFDDSMKKKLKTLGIEPIKFHWLRKTYATRLFENGVPPKTVQTLLGHADIQTTLNIYTEVMDTEKQKAVDTLNNIFNF